MKKKIIIVTSSCVVVVIGLCALAGFLIVGAMNAPLYKPGMVRAESNLSGPLDPPEQTDGDRAWQVEPDVSLYFEAIGDGRPVLVIHGGPGIPYDGPWQGLDSLTDDFVFYYYHQRGCGDSTRPFDRFESKNFYANMKELDRKLGLGAQIADVERIRRILKEEKLILIGHSFGGFIATLYAAEFPERVEKLVLVAPAGVLVLPSPDGDLNDRIRASIPAADRPEFDLVVEQYFNFGSIFKKSEADLARLQREYGRYFLAALGDESVFDSNETTYTNGGWMVFAMYFSMGRKHDFRSALQSISAPVLVVHGADDSLTRSGAAMYGENISGSRSETIDGVEAGRAGHFVFDDQPQAFGALVGAFLREAD